MATQRQRLHRYTLAEYHRLYCAPRFVNKHNAWLIGAQSEIESVKLGRMNKLYIVSYADKTQSICDHTCIVYCLVGKGIRENEE